MPNLSLGALLPCIEFDIAFLTLNRSTSDQSVGEIVCQIKNVGPGVGFVTNVHYRVRYRIAGESGKMADQLEPDFAHRLPPKGAFYLDPEERFIQPGVTQWYRKPLALPASTYIIHVWGGFDYKVSVRAITNLLARLLREALTQNPTAYAVRRTFTIGDDVSAGAAVDSQMDSDLRWR
jgi:hypothetical protein